MPSKQVILFILPLKIYFLKKILSPAGALKDNGFVGKKAEKKSFAK